MTTEETKEDVTTDSIERELPCRLEPAQLFAVAERKAVAELELEQEEARLDEAKAGYAERIKALEKKIREMGQTIRSKEERRVIDCYERFVAGTIETVRKDTREVIERRAATLLDSQRRIPHVDGKPDDKAKKSKPKLAVVPDDGIPTDAPKSEHFNPLISEAAAEQIKANVSITDDGDVVPPEGNGKSKRKAKRK